MRLPVTCLIAGCLAFAGCRSQDPGSEWSGATILIGIDGLRWDYPDRMSMTGFNSVADRGVRADALVPVFPTKTFPNFYALATGLYPDNSGVVNNSMYDPIFDARFRMSDTNAVRDGRWWGGEPIWVTAERQGLRTAAYFWVGSEAEIAGYRPTEWKTYDGSVPNQLRVDQVVEWLSAPPESRPELILLYFSSIDDAGHRYGPDAQETRSTVQKIDRLVASLTAQLEEHGILDRINLVIVSDHGMARRSEDRVIFIDDYIDTRRAGSVSLGEHVTLWPQPEAIESVYLALADAHPALKV